MLNRRQVLAGASSVAVIGSVAPALAAAPEKRLSELHTTIVYRPFGASLHSISTLWPTKDFRFHDTCYWDGIPENVVFDRVDGEHRARIVFSDGRSVLAPRAREVAISCWELFYDGLRSVRRFDSWAAFVLLDGKALMMQSHVSRVFLEA